MGWIRELARRWLRRHVDVTIRQLEQRRDEYKRRYRAAKKTLAKMYEQKKALGTRG
jgi:predicted transcriptional regulator